MRKLILIAATVLATTSAHAELSGQPAAAATAPVVQPVAAIAQPAPAVQPAPITVQAVPAVQVTPTAPILQTTNPQAQRVLKELQAHGLVKLQPQPAPQPVQAPQAQAVQVPTAQAQVVQSQPVQTQPVQTQVAPAQPVATASSQPVAQPVTASATPSASVSKPVVHATSHRDADEAKARRIAARYGIHW